MACINGVLATPPASSEPNGMPKNSVLKPIDVTTIIDIVIITTRQTITPVTLTYAIYNLLH